MNQTQADLGNHGSFTRTAQRNGGAERGLGWIGGTLHLTSTPTMGAVCSNGVPAVWEPLATSTYPSCTALSPRPSSGCEIATVLTLPPTPRPISTWTAVHADVNVPMSGLGVPLSVALRASARNALPCLREFSAALEGALRLTEEVLAFLEPVAFLFPFPGLWTGADALWPAIPLPPRTGLLACAPAGGLLERSALAPRPLPRAAPGHDGACGGRGSWVQLRLPA